MSNSMGLTIPTASVTPGPQFATEVNDDLETIAEHDHTTGNGVKVPSAGLNINADLPFGLHNATQVRSLRLAVQSAVLNAITDTGCVYDVNGNLYWNNGSGTPVKITDGASLNASAIGGFTGLAGTSGAATYDNALGKFTFTSGTNLKAALSAGPVTIADTAASAAGITVKSPTAVATPFNITLPGSLPASTKPLLIDASGALAAGGTGWLQTADIADGAVTRAKQAAVGDQLSSSCGSFSTSSGSFVNVTNLAVTLTTSGRRVMLYLVPDNTTNTAGASIFDNTNDIASAVLKVVVSGGASADIGLQSITGRGSAPFTDSVADFVGRCLASYSPSAGTYTFTVQAKVGTASEETFSLANVCLLAYEL